MELHNGSQAIVIYDVEHGMAVEPIQGHQASSPVDLGCTELLHVPALTSVFF